MLTALQGIFKAITDSLRPWIVLAPWEAAIRIRLGKRVVLLPPGFHWRIPYFDRIEVQTTRIRLAALPLQTLTTLDGKTLCIGGVCGYAIADLVKLYTNVAHAEDTIRNLAAETIAAAVTATNQAQLTPGGIAATCTAALGPKLEAYGLDQASIRVTDFSYARVLRLIRDERWGTYGDVLNTGAKK